MAISDLAPGLVETSVIAPEQEFTLKPLLVKEPFGQPAERHELEHLIERTGSSLIRGTVARVIPQEHRLELADGSELDYEFLMVCVGGRPQPAYADVHTFWSGSSSLPVNDLIDRALASQGGCLDLVVPPGTSWPLPLYELALMFRRRGDDRGERQLRIRILTPEEGPLLIFGRAASVEIVKLLAARRIEIETGTDVVDDGGIDPVVPAGYPLPRRTPVVSLPTIDGPRIPGLPADPRGFIPIDLHCRVVGAADVYAAGDGTTFPVKQGGLATQEADAAAEHIAQSLGANVEAQGFHPVLRGKLLTGTDSLSMRNEIDGSGGEGVTSPDCLWWPPGKIDGRYLSSVLSDTVQRVDFDPASRQLDVEVSLPREWHAEPFTSPSLGSSGSG